MDLKTAGAIGVGVVAGFLFARGTHKKASIHSDPDQPVRHAQNVKDGVATVVDIDYVFNGHCYKGKHVVVTGANRGLGLVLCQELVKLGAHVYGTTRRPSSQKWDTTGLYTEIDGIELTSDTCMDTLVVGLKGQKIDLLINNAGYFMEAQETLSSLNFAEELKQIDICALGSLRIAAALVNSGLLGSGGKISCITSQGGSIAWRDVQCPAGGDYGHHMSKSANNMMAKLLANEVKSKNIAVSILHPGFNRTDMTRKYSAIWDEHGAVEPSIGAKRVLHQISTMGMAETGQFVNCEDGKEIPW